MERKTMPRWGVGPQFAVISAILTVLGIMVHIHTEPRFSINVVPDIVFLVIGLSFMIFGGYLWLGSGLKIGTAVKEDVLVRTGVYAIVRHPHYAGILFVLTGVLVLMKSYLLLPIPFVLYIVLRILIKKEEDVLLEHFGQEYETYKEEVNAFIPGLRKA